MTQCRLLLTVLLTQQALTPGGSSVLSLVPHGWTFAPASVARVSRATEQRELDEPQTLDLFARHVLHAFVAGQALRPVCDARTDV